MHNYIYIHIYGGPYYTHTHTHTAAAAAAAAAGGGEYVYDVEPGTHQNLFVALNVTHHKLHSVYIHERDADLHLFTEILREYFKHLILLFSLFR